MAQIIHIDNLDAPELLAYAHLTEAQLRHKLEPSMGVFIAESPKVIYRALEAGIRPKSLLMEEKHLTGQGAPLLAACGDIPVYTAPREVLSALTGYTLTRGILCCMSRPALPEAENLLATARRVAVLEGSWIPPMWAPSSARRRRWAWTRCSSPPPAAIPSPAGWCG